MKKLMFAVAAMSAGICLADVTSANVVGYSTITLPEGEEYGMYAMPFDSVSDAEGGLTMYEVFPEPLKSFTGNTGASTSDQIMFWYNGGYKSLYLYSKESVVTRHGKWINPASVPDSSWGSANKPTELKIKGGTSFWIKRYVPTSVNKSDKAEMAAALPAKNLTVNGQVVTKQSGVASYTITPATTSAGAYTLVAAGFTAPFIPNPDLVDATKPKATWLEDGCKGGTGASSSDQLMLWYNGSYKSLYLYSKESVPSRHGYWINPASVPDASWGSANKPSTVQIQPTQGFWYLRQKGATEPLEFKVQQPYSL